MPHMYPATLPPDILTSRMLKGEVDVYNALMALPDDYDVFYNRTPDTRSGSSAFKRRIDFIILNERRGLLAMEVKGGQIRLTPDGRFEQFLSRLRIWKPTDPHAQIAAAMRDLVYACKNDGVNYWIPSDVCVVFPHTERRELSDGLRPLPNGTLCGDDLPLFSTLIPTLFSSPRKDIDAWKRENYLDMRRRLQNLSSAELPIDRTSHKEKKPVLPPKHAVFTPPKQAVAPPVQAPLPKPTAQLSTSQIIAGIIAGLIAAFAWVYFR